MVFQFSYFIICISAKNFSAKKKPKKSSNENEGDVSTIPQESQESGTIKIIYISMMYYLYAEYSQF